MNIRLLSLILACTFACTELPVCYAENTTPGASANEDGDYNAEELTQWWKRELKRRKKAGHIIRKIKKQSDVEKATNAIRKIYTNPDGTARDPIPEKKPGYMRSNKYKDIWLDQDTQVRTCLPEKLVRRIHEISLDSPLAPLEARDVTPDADLEKVIEEYLSPFPGVF